MAIASTDTNKEENMPGLSTRYRDVQFPLHQPIELPQDAVKINAGDTWLYVSSDKATYIVVNAVGASQVAHLLQGHTPAETLAAICAEFNVSADQAMESLRKVLAEIETNQFYANASVETDVSDSDFPLLAYLTRRCNLRCTHCYMDAGKGSASELTADEWQNVIADYSVFCDLLHKRPRVTFSGGEPLLKKDALTIIEGAHQRGCLTEIFTNGTRIKTAEDAHRISQCVDLAQLSLDGATESVNDSIRGKGAFSATLHAIRLLMNNGVKVRLAMTVMPSNYEDILQNIASLLLGIGSNVELRLALANVQGRAQSSVRFRDSHQGELALRAILEELYRAGIRKPRKEIPNLRSISCGYGRNVAVSDTGVFYGCAIMEFPLGSVRHDRFHDLASRAVQLGADTAIDNIKGCRECELRYFCAGLCRLNNWIYKQDLSASCCTPEKKAEVIKKLAARQSETSTITRTRPLVGSFWLAQ
jgi:radical SAM protein with 4Fe4S-binding SPASM domain